MESHVRPSRERAPADLAVHAPAALRTVFHIAESWQLSARETRILLGSPPESTFYKWKAGKVGVVSRDLLERVSYLLGIYKALQLLLPDPDAADAWVKRPNDARPSMVAPPSMSCAPATWPTSTWCGSISTRSAAGGHDA